VAETKAKKTAKPKAEVKEEATAEEWDLKSSSKS
jgi:hypothetical protein